jgi:hypothetical protein
MVAIVVKSRFFLKTVIVFCVALICVACDASYTEEDEYQVYSDLIKGYTTSSSSPLSPLLVIGSETVPPRFLGRPEELTGYMKADFPDMPDVMIAEFMKVTAQPHKLEKKFKIPVTYDMLEEIKYQEFFDEGPTKGWKKFYKRYPKSSGFLRFSRVAFDLSNQLAYVYTEHACGGLCGSGAILQMKKTNGIWVLKAEKNIWVS